MNSSVSHAINVARHALVSFHGLIVSDQEAKSVTWSLDTAALVSMLDAALTECAETQIQHRE